MQFEPRPRDFSARQTRRARSRAVGAGLRRRHAGRRAALLGLAIAAPAFAAPGGWGGPAPDAQHAASPAPMPFDLPGESFPAPAFHYLAAQAPLPTGAIAEPAAETAHPLLAGGTGRDRARAQQCLTMAIYYEAASESDSGQRAVAQVVLNRVAHPAWPDTVCGVVFQGSERATGCQFTFTCDGSLARQPARLWWDRAARVARAALAGAVHAPAGLATHYHTVQVNPYWAASLDQVGTIGAHRFYRWPGANGRLAAFSAAYRGGEPLAAPHPRAPEADGLPLPAPATLAVAASSLPHPAGPTMEQPAAVPPLADSLPASGTVRPEYAHSGQWIARP